jgi:viologen exporter family transport system permease protein
LWSQVVDVVLSAVREYCLLAWMWIRSSLVYRTSFVTMTLAQFMISMLDFLAILVMFSNIDVLGGFSLGQVAFLYGVSGCCLGAADLLVGNVERLGRRIRDGSLDALLIRPVPTLVQVCADDFQLRRVGRLVQAGLVLWLGVTGASISWSPVKVCLLAVTLFSGTAIFCSVFIVFACFQFVTQDAAEVANAFTYGGNTLTQYPLTIFPNQIIKAVTFIIPVAFVNWYPCLYILGQPDPLDLPTWTQFAAPLVAILLALLTGWIWQRGIHGYRSTGS